MRQQASPSGRELVLRWTMGAAMVLWAAYVLHSEVSGQGIVGWVTDLAVQQFGSASTNLCLLAAMTIGVIPIGIVFRVAARAFGVTLVPQRGTLPGGTPGQIRRRAVLGGIAILLAAAGLIAIVLPRPDSSPAVPFDLDAAATAAPPEGPQVAVMGTPQPDLAAGYRETSSGSSSSTIHRYIPLTAQAWTPGTPVRFFLAEIEHDDGRRDGIAMIPAPGRRPHYEGHLRRNAMPTLARGAFERNGTRLAEPYWVISNDSEEVIAMVMLIGGLGFALGLASIIVGLRAARQVAQRPASGRSPTPPPVPPRGGRDQPPAPGAPSGQPRTSGVARDQHPLPPGNARNHRTTPPPIPPPRERRPTPSPIPPGARRKRITTPPPIPPAALRRRSA